MLTRLPARAAVGADEDYPAPRPESGTPTRFGWAEIVVIVAIIAICAWLLMPPFRRGSGGASPRMYETNTLKQFAIALHSFNDVHGTLPGPAIRSPDGKPLLSWRVAILPYIEEERLYKQFRLDEPWDSPHNGKLIPRMPRLFLRPNEPANPAGRTHYQAVVGKGLIFDYAYTDKEGNLAARRLEDITDGMATTVMLVVAKRPVVWTRPDDIDADDGAPILPRLDTRFKGTIVTLADGSVRFLQKTTEPTLRAALTADGGERIADLDR